MAMAAPVYTIDHIREVGLATGSLWPLKLHGPSSSLQIDTRRSHWTENVIAFAQQTREPSITAELWE